MHRTKVAIICGIFLILPFANIQPVDIFDEVNQVMQTDMTNEVSQFGTGFDETVIATSNDGLNNPRDLEFHPSSSRNDELWIVNRADDSVVIIHDTGLSTQSSEKRLDSHRNHFMEEVSSIAFGSYDEEFDFQFATGQESRNTYNGQASPNNFMGPALWPSSLSHFAVEHQNDGLLGSHIDMLHESPNGMGIAHDSGNSYWYFDGYYGNLVYYDFQEDHDTGMDDHSDGIVRRHTDIQLTRFPGVPGHMVMDKSNGILYIADTGADRVLWVNTLDTSITSTSMMNDNSRLEPLQEYSAITGREFGVLASGITRPSGIALIGDSLFVGSNGNDSIWNFDLSSSGKMATMNTIIETEATSLMGLEIGPDSKLYYVDGGENEVIRIDPFDDQDKDHVRDSLDNCIGIPNENQTDYDLDGLGDLCDDDGDGDGVDTDYDSCEFGLTGWTSSQVTDHDGDGCNDESEDDDDDNDGLDDYRDDCKKSPLGYTINSETDYDNDGCIDENEDLDDDSDNVPDVEDDCPKSQIGFNSNLLSDNDQDGCEDSSEDLDDDNDGVDDADDWCEKTYGTSTQGRHKGCVDTDSDSWADTEDDFPTDNTQWMDSDDDGYGDEINGNQPDSCPALYGNSSIDRFGCLDSDGDGYSNPIFDYTVADGADAIPDDKTQWIDRDGDGFGDNLQGNNPDSCPDEFGLSNQDGVLGCLDSDGDGWSDSIDTFPEDITQHSDFDNDGFGDSNGNQSDSCPEIYGTSSIDRFGCIDSDGDGWSDLNDKYVDDNLRWSDTDGDGYPDQQNLEDSDQCPETYGESKKDVFGCVDSDGDGFSDSADAYPNDSSKWEDDDYSMILIISAISLLILAPILINFSKRRSKLSTNLDLINDKSQAFGYEQTASVKQEILQTTHTGPPLPPEGLPPGWTIEQWNYYGHQYIESQNNMR